MDWRIELMKAAGPYLGAVISLVGFTILIFQLRSNRLSVQNQTHGLIYQLSNNVYKMFVDKPELRPYFYDSSPLPTEEPERSKVLAAAELLTDFFENIVHAAEILEPDIRDTWFIYMRDIHENSVAFRGFLEHRKGDYTLRLREALGADVDTIQPNEPGAAADRGLIGCSHG